MGKKVSARIKNKVKARFARAITQLEKSLGSSRASYNDMKKRS